MKKTIAIIVAIATFVGSLATNVYYVFDNDNTTNPDVGEVVEKGKDVYESFIIETDQ